MTTKRRSLLTTAGRIDRGAVMRRAWRLMTEVYSFGRLRFSSIGRRCFAWCLATAWREAREEMARQAIPAEVRAARVANLNVELSNLRYLDDWRHVNRREAEIRAELDRLAA